MKAFRFFWGIIFFFFSVAWAQETPEVENFTHNFSKGYIIYANDAGSGQDVTLQFGLQLAEYFKWDSVTENFILSDSLIVGGNIDLTENKLTFDSDNTGLGADVRIVANQGSDPAGEIRYNATTNQWEVSNDGGDFESIKGGGSVLAPYVESVVGPKIQPNTSGSFIILGGNFDYNSVVEIPGWQGTIDSVDYVSNKELKVFVTAGSSESVYSVIVKNGGSPSTGYLVDKGADAVEVMSLPPWVDLRSGGASFSSGNGAGNDIRYRSGMSMVRDANGMYFTGTGPWGSWAKFESLGWARGENKTFEWVFTAPTSNMMIGIGSTATNESSTAQYAEAEVQAYFSSSTSLWGLYGNNGTIGSAGNQNVTTTISSSGIYKIKFEDDGGLGGTFSIFQLPGNSPSDWDDESTVLSSFVIGGTLNPDESNIMPFIIPQNGGTQRFVAVRVY